MTKITRLEVAQIIQDSWVIPLFYHPDTDICKKVIKACYDGGFRLFEFTNRGDFAHEVFAEIKKWAEQELPGLVLGVGSVVDAGTCSLYIQLGASFIVSPLLNEDMTKVCNRRKVLWIPGCGTVSEISKAEELGAEIIKIYPASQLGGPAFIKAVKAPCPWTQLMPSGGVKAEEVNLKEWYDAGACCVGMGSDLVSKDIIEGRQFERLTEKARDIVRIVNTIKGR